MEWSRNLMGIRSLALAALSVVCFWPTLSCAQTQAEVSTPSTAVTDARYPDQGFLSDSSYANQYFGFAFDFPPSAQLQPVNRPMAPDGQVQLLELAGPAPHRAVVSITARPKREKGDPDAKQTLRRDLDNELFYGVEELRGLSKISIGKHLFYYYETRRGIDEHYLLATDLDGYVLRVYLAGRDDKLVAQLQASFVGSKWFEPSQARQYAGTDAKPYEGPAMSSHRLATLKSDSPASHLDPGVVANNEYRNQELGLTYRLPVGWMIGTEPGVQREVERVRQQQGDGPWMGRAESELVKACNRVLFSARKEPAGPNGKVSYDGFGEITLSAMATPCVPDMQFPSSVTDADGIKAFLAQFALTHPLLRDVRQGRAFETGGRLFIVTEGMVTFQIEGEDLSRRLSIAMAITEHRGWLLTWFFGAPHDSELRELMDTKMVLEPEPMLSRAKTSEVTAGGGAPSGAGQPVAETPVNSGAASGNAGPASSDAGSTSAQSTATNPDKTAANLPSAGPDAKPTNTTEAPATTPPSLLRPGESMDEQQMKGTPVPKKH